MQILVLMQYILNWGDNMKKVIIDCDPGIDDSLALMLALTSKELEILGITVVSGNVELHQATENAFQSLKLMG